MKSGAGVEWLVLSLPVLAQRVKGRAGRQGRGGGQGPPAWLSEGGVIYRQGGAWADWDTVRGGPSPTPLSRAALSPGDSSGGDEQGGP